MTVRAIKIVIAAAALLVLAAGCAGSGAAGPGNAGQGSSSPGASRNVAASPPAAGSATASAAPRASAAFSQCGPPDAPARPVTLHAAGGARLAAVEAGTGPRGVVLVPELGPAGKCGWWTYAAYLAARGYRVLLFDHRCAGESSCPAGAAGADLMADIRSAVSRLRRDGAARVVLMGASQGGSEVLIAGTVPPRGVTAVISLSADELTTPLASRPYPRTGEAAPSRLRLPVLFAVAAQDPYVTVQQTRHLYRAARSRSKRLVLLGPAAGHGWDMLASAAPGGVRPSLSRTVVAFLRQATA